MALKLVLWVVTPCTNVVIQAFRRRLLPPSSGYSGCDAM